MTFSLTRGRVDAVVRRIPEQHSERQMVTAPPLPMKSLCLFSLSPGMPPPEPDDQRSQAKYNRRAKEYEHEQAVQIFPPIPQIATLDTFDVRIRPTVRIKRIMIFMQPKQYEESQARDKGDGNKQSQNFVWPRFHKIARLDTPNARHHPPARDLAALLSCE
jgi:hypothetical protein